MSLREKRERKILFSATLSASGGFAEENESPEETGAKNPWLLYES